MRKKAWKAIAARTTQTASNRLEGRASSGAAETDGLHVTARRTAAKATYATKDYVAFLLEATARIWTTPEPVAVKMSALEAPYVGLVYLLAANAF